MALRLSSSAFANGGVIPKKHTGEGEDVSPALAWDGVPTRAKELALICDDPDAPRPTPWVHWVLYKIPVGQRSLSEGSRGIGLEGQNDFGRTGYGGPMPPPGHGVHHYHFRLYALDEPIDLARGKTKDECLARMQGHVIEECELIGTYERKAGAKATSA